MEEEELKNLLERYKSGDVTDLEKAFLESWYLQQENPENDDDYPESAQREDAAEVWSKLQVDASKPLRVYWPQRVAAAAVILLTLASGLYLYLNSNTKPVNKIASTHVADKIQPGKNSAVLILGNGKKISLTDAKNGVLAKASGMVITKASDGQVICTVAPSAGPTKTSEYNTIQTPKGGQYQVRLPDGSNIWLNAASSLKYPAVFVKKDRRISLEGEAYFEVAKDQSRPFIVSTAGQTVTVLGTHFNISSYSDDQNTRTTLLEGSVRVDGSEASKIIKPGQQAVLAKNNLYVKDADIEETMAWKNGYFRFNDEKIEDVARKLARWYDVEILFEGEKSTEGFNGVISRSKNLSQVLKMLEKTKAIHFKTEGRRIIVKQ